MAAANSGRCRLTQCCRGIAGPVICATQQATVGAACQTHRLQDHEGQARLHAINGVGHQLRAVLAHKQCQEDEQRPAGVGWARVGRQPWKQPGVEGIEPAADQGTRCSPYMSLHNNPLRLTS